MMAKRLRLECPAYLPLSDSEESSGDPQQQQQQQQQQEQRQKRRLRWPEEEGEFEQPSMEMLAAFSSHLLLMPDGRAMPLDMLEVAPHSSYLAALVRYSTERTLTLPWKDYPFLTNGFRAFLDFARNSNANASGQHLLVSEKNAMDLLLTADYLGCQELRHQTLAFLEKRCTNSLEFALDLLVQTESYCLPELDAIAFKAVLTGFPRAADGDAESLRAWQRLSVDQVCRVLRHDALNSRSERQTLHLAWRWLLADRETRSPHTDRLLACVRLGQLSSMDWSSRTDESEEGAADAQNACRRRRRCRAASLQANAPETAAVDTPRLPYEAVLVIGGWGHNPTTPHNNDDYYDGANNNNQPVAAASGPAGPQAACQAFNPRANQWTLHTPDEPSDRGVGGLGSIGIGRLGRRVYAGCAAFGSLVFVAGGFDGLEATRSVFFFDLARPAAGWQEAACMLQKRYYVCCAAVEEAAAAASSGDSNGVSGGLDGRLLYAIGGHNGSQAVDGHTSRLSSVERLSIGEGVWTEVGSLCRVRSDAGATALGRRVFVAGGFDGQHYHRSAEVFDPDVNQWTLLPSRMAFARGGVSLVTLGNGAIYALGGNDGQQRVREVEKYCSEERGWVVDGRLLQAKSNMSAAAVDDNGRILAIGGWSDSDEPGVRASVELYSPSEVNDGVGQSQAAAELCFAASATAACTVRADPSLLAPLFWPAGVN